MRYTGIQDFIEILKTEEELIEINQLVSSDLEITEIADRFSKTNDGGKALLFTNTGNEFPVLINAFGSEKRMCLALGVAELEDLKRDVEELFKLVMSPKENIWDKLKMLPQLGKLSSWMPKSVSGKGKCQEVIHTDPDLSKLPILKCWPADGGPFITLPMVITKDPVTGIRNCGMYRMQVFDKDLTGMHWHKHKVGARHYNEYKKLGKRMPVTVALGGDPAHTFSATAPLPDNIDEFMLSGFLRKKKVEMVRCITNELEVPADADIIIEGYVDPEEELIYEGPFGDHTGFYSLADYYPRFHVTCITHRKNAVYPATIVGVPPMEDAWIAKATERIFLAPIKYAMLPEIVDYDMPFAGVAHNLTVVAIDKTFAGQGLKVMNAMWGAGQMMFNKVLVVVDKDVDVHNYTDLLQAVFLNVDPASDIHFSKGPLDVLDHSSSKFSFGGKLCVDATTKFEEEKGTSQNSFPLVNDSLESDMLELSSMIKKVNIDLVNKGFSCIVIGIEKSAKNQVDELVKLLENTEFLQTIKSIIIVDYTLDIHNMDMVVWWTLGNIDASRDVQILKRNQMATVVFDGTRKSYSLDGFERDWPNVVVSSEETIRLVDEKWEKLSLGEFIESPSLTYRKLNNNEGAVAESSKS